MLALTVPLVLSSTGIPFFQEDGPQALRSSWSSEGLSAAELADALRGCDRLGMAGHLQDFLRKGMDYAEVRDVLGPPDDLWPVERLRATHPGSYTAAGACIRYKTGRCRKGPNFDYFELTEICFNQDRTLAFWSGRRLDDSDPMAGYDDTRSARTLWSD